MREGVGSRVADGALTCPGHARKVQALVGHAFMIELLPSSSAARSSSVCCVLYSLFCALTDELLRPLQVQVKRAKGGVAFFNDDPDKLTEQSLNLRDRLVVSSYERDRDAEMSGNRRIDPELAGRVTVQAHIADKAPGMGEGRTRGTRFGVTTYVKNSGDTSFLDTLHHTQRFVATGDKPNFRMQLFGDEVTHSVMRIVDDHLFRARSEWPSTAASTSRVNRARARS